MIPATYFPERRLLKTISKTLGNYQFSQIIEVLAKSGRVACPYATAAG